MNLGNYFKVRYILFFGLMLLALATHQLVITAVIIFLSVWALAGPRQAIQALSLNCLILLLSQGIWQFPPGLGVLRWIVLFCAALRLLPFASIGALYYLLPLGFFFLVTFVLSWACSPYFVVSIAKLAAFTLCVGTVLTAFASLGREELEKIKKWFFTLIITVVLFSIPTLAFPRIAYMRNGEGFQGILQHPQALAIFVVPLAAYVGTEILISKNRQSISKLLFASLLFFILFLTKARTSFAAVFLASAVVVFWTILVPRFSSIDWAPFKGMFRTSLLATIFGLIILLSPQVSESVRGFVFKNSNARTVTEAFNKSRGKGAAFFWQRFMEKPFTGHGFGIDVAHGNEKNPPTFLGIPIAAATEKGFLPAAFAEEVGIIGILAIIPFLITLFLGAAQTGVAALIAMFFGCLFVNIGEAIFFSPGYIGGYFWLLIGLGTAKGWHAEN